MTREEAIEVLRRLPIGLMDLSCEQKSDLTEALNIALAALRGPTRDQVEKVWRGEWEEERFEGELEGWQHRECGRHSAEKSMWCPKCGKAMTDEAVDIMLKRLEALHENNR